MNQLLVGLDVGTTSVKAVVFGTDGREVSAGRVVTPWTPAPYGVEMDATTLVSAAVDALNSALTDAPKANVLAVGVTSMGESGVLLDSRGVPVAPVIAWHDTRDETEVGDLKTAIGADRFAQRTGLPLRGQWSLTKHRWLLSHYPEAKAAVRWLNIAEWIIRSLGGEESAEQSLASRTGWLELDSRQWWTESLEWSGAKASLMPELITGGTPVGRLTHAGSLRCLRGAVLTAAGHDHQAATIGTGTCGSADELDSCGTAEAVVRTIPSGLVAPAAIAALAAAGITTGWHVLADRWCLLGGTQGGLVLQRVLELLGRTSEDVSELDKDALVRDPRSLVVAGVNEDVLSVSGIGTGACPSDLWRATLEAVTAEAAAVHAAVSTVAGPHQRLVITGGWSHSSGLMEVKRRVLGPLRIAPVNEAGARGAALLGGLAGGVYASTQEFPALEFDEQSERTL